jgi:hypothetical protein
MRDFAPASWIPTVLLLACVVGCGANTAPKMTTIPVKGKITYNGQPLTKGIVRFRPVDTGRAASGKLQPDGTFVLTTFQENDGAVAGLHQVSVSGTGSSPSRELVPTKYARPLTSKLEAQVSPENAEFTFDLK